MIFELILNYYYEMKATSVFLRISVGRQVSQTNFPQFLKSLPNVYL